MIISAVNHNDFKNRLEKAIASRWQVKFMVANDHAYIAIMEM
jgi:hypothetical protein